MEKIKAPFTEEQVKNLNVFQEKGTFHPFTCPQDGDINHVLYEFNKLQKMGYEESYSTYIREEKEKGIQYPESQFTETKLIATKDGWICPVCKYKQDWAHDFMVERK